MSLRSFLMAGWLLFCSTLVLAQNNDHTFACTVDTYTSLTNPNTSNGGTGTLSVKATGVSNQERAYVFFSLTNATFPSGIPYNARILSATLLMRGTVTGGTPALRAERVLTTWDNSLTHNSASGISFGADAVSSLNPATGQYTFDVTAHVRAMVAGTAPSFGWRIRHNNETATTPVCNFVSKEGGSTPPTLRIQWYVPLGVTSAVVNQASDTSQSDGSILPQISYGVGNRRYQWVRGNNPATVIDTTSSLLDVPSDWYGLRVTDETTDTLYMAFLVGVKCGNSRIQFKPGKNYISETVITGQASSEGTNYFNSPAFQATRWQVGSGAYYSIKGLMRFQLWVDPAITIDTSSLYLFGRGHSIAGGSFRENSSRLVQITTPWDERTVTYNTAPATSTAINANIPATTTSTQGTITNILPFWNAWKNNNLTNYGFMMRLNDTVTNVKANMNYQTSVNSNPNLWPFVQFSVRGTCNLPPLNQISYSELKREPDAGYANTAEGKLKFYFTEEYKIASGKYLPMRIYNQSHQLMGSVDINGVQTSGLATLSYTYADNRYILNLTNLSLQNGQIYLLEVETSTKEKRYLKFIYRN